MGDEVKTKDLALKAQKKILSSMSSKAFTKVLIDDKTNDILDEFYKIRKIQTGNKDNAEKLIKNIVKVMIKVAVLQKNDQFSSEELKLADKLQQKTKMASMMIVSFYEVDFTFDKFVLSKLINEGRTILQQLVAAHLSEKTKTRINNVFDILGDTEFLEELFNPDGRFRCNLTKIVENLNKLLENGVL